MELDIRFKPHSSVSLSSDQWSKSWTSNWIQSYVCMFMYCYSVFYEKRQRQIFPLFHGHYSSVNADP